MCCVLDGAVQDGDLGDDVPEPVAGDVEFQNVVRCVAPQFVFGRMFLIGADIVIFSIFFIIAYADDNFIINVYDGI